MGWRTCVTLAVRTGQDPRYNEKAIGPGAQTDFILPVESIFLLLGRTIRCTVEARVQVDEVVDQGTLENASARNMAMTRGTGIFVHNLNAGVDLVGRSE